MSLDVYLHAEPREVPCRCRECGNEHTSTEAPSLYSANITHNLNKMASEAGIYEALWRPDEIGVMKAHQLIPLLEKGFCALMERPDHFRQFDSPNGWGKYEHFVPFVREYLNACQGHPEAYVRVSR